MTTPTVGVDVLVSLANRLTAPLKKAEGEVAKAGERMNRRLSLSLKLAGGGAAAAGIAALTKRTVTGFTDSIREVERAKGELATLGVQDLDAVVSKGLQMQTQLAGLTADAFVRASYDIKSGISNLSDQGVAEMTASAMVVAKATRGQAEQMTSLFATSYGIFKQHMEGLSDAEFGEQFGAVLAASVKQFKTDGAKMQQAIESAGAGAAQLGMAMDEQMALLGMMQQQMQAGEAGTALRAFATNAARAHEAFGAMQVTAERPVLVRILDENGQLREMPQILADLKARYGETLDAFEAAEIKDAFGTEEAMKMINALYGQEEAVRANAAALTEAGARGSEFTTEMAKLADNNWDSAMVLMSQQIDALQQKIGQRLLPAVKRLAPVISAFVDRALAWVDANPELVTGIGAVVVGLGAFAAIMAPILLGAAAMTSSIGALTGGVTAAGRVLVWLGRAVLPIVRTAVMAIGRALIANPIGVLIMGIAGAAYAIYHYWEPISAFFKRVWDSVVETFKAATSWITDLIGGVTSINWAELITLPDWSNWLTFTWVDVLPQWDWGAIIPDLPDLKSMFGDANESLDVRLENRASNLIGMEWQEGLNLVDQYRDGLIGIADVKARLADVAGGGGLLFDSFEVNRAQEMLALLEEIETKSAAPAPAIESPENLLEAARAASELEAQLPKVSVAATEALTAVKAAIAQIVAAMTETDLTAHGARIGASLAAGIRSQIGPVRAAAEAMTRAIRAAMPSGANVNIGLAGPKVQARATGGSYNPGWLLTGENGPELRYANEGGYIAHNRALQGMQAMAERTRALLTGTGAAPIPAMATVAASGAPVSGARNISYAPSYDVQINGAGGDLGALRDMIQDEMMAAEERAQAELRRMLHD